MIIPQAKSPVVGLLSAMPFPTTDRVFEYKLIFEVLSEKAPTEAELVVKADVKVLMAEPIVEHCGTPLMKTGGLWRISRMLSVTEACWGACNVAAAMTNTGYAGFLWTKTTLPRRVFAANASARVATAIFPLVIELGNSKPATIHTS